MIWSRLERAEERIAGRIAFWSARMGSRVEPAAGRCRERAELLSLPPPGRVSSNGSCRLVRARDGWIAVNLPRPEDRELAPALVGAAIDTADPWPALEEILSAIPAGQVVEQARLLGLAVTCVGETPVADGKPNVDPDEPNPRARPWTRPPRVVDLSALWAGPLCGALLAEAGCEVLKIETRQRPDSTLLRSPAFDSRLNGAKRRWRMDAADEKDRARLLALLADADVVVTNARPRALGWLGGALRSGCCWIAIRAHTAEPDRIGFGDDCAAAGGLVAFDDETPRFIGDAAADPLAGLAAAALAFRALALRRGGRHDVALASTAAGAAHG